MATPQWLDEEQAKAWRSVQIMQAVGKWMDGNGQSIYKAEPCRVKRSAFANFTRIGNTLYIHAYFWPGTELNIGGLETKVKSAKLLRSGQNVRFEQTQSAILALGQPGQYHIILVAQIRVEREVAG